MRGSRDLGWDVINYPQSMRSSLWNKFNWADSTGDTSGVLMVKLTVLQDLKRPLCIQWAITVLSFSSYFVLLLGEALLRFLLTSS